MTLSLTSLTRCTGRFLLAVVCTLVPLTVVTRAVAAPGAVEWLTVEGDSIEPFNALQNVVQADPASISDASGVRTMQIRVSRSDKRVSWDDVPYRSFTAQVEFDCEKKTARYISLTYFMEPAWRGISHETSVYPREKHRPMAFRSMEPNPTQRIVRAACDSKSITSN